MSVAAQNDKELHSVPTNADIGAYFRRRLGLQSGVEVTLQDLARGGSRFVRMYRVGPESYHLEYSAAADSEGMLRYGMSELRAASDVESRP